MGRTFVLGLCLAMLALLAYVTFGVAASEGISVRVVISGVVPGLPGDRGHRSDREPAA